MVQNNYPIVFIHGMYGFGEEELIYKVLPYYGMVTGSLIKRLRAKGYRAFAPKVGPVASAWDRACELYAMLTGGTVDYGKAHAKKYGHERYGRTFEKPLIPDWGTVDADGNLVKIHMFGHSFGGATMRAFVQILAEGSEEERQASGDNVSPLFKGGKGDWVCSITSLAGPHDGTTIMHALPTMIKGLRYGTYYIANILGNTSFKSVYDFHLEQFGLTSLPGYRNQLGKMFNFEGAKAAAESHDNLFWDLRIEGAAEMNERTKCHDTTYYFSVPTLGTKDGPDGHPVPDSIMNPVLYPFAYAMAKYDGKHPEVDMDASWYHGDGLATFGSSFHPKNEPFIAIDDADKANLQKGVWHVMHAAESDHGTIIGGSVKYIGKGKYKLFDAFYNEHIALLQTLK